MTTLKDDLIALLLILGKALMVLLTFAALWYATWWLWFMLTGERALFPFE